MRHLIIFLLTLISISTSAQLINNLDKKNGFKDFTFGDDLDEYDGKLSPRFEGNTYFRYLPKEPNELFDWNFWLLYLGFDDNQKLNLVQVYWPDDEIIYKDILGKLEKAFGESSSIDFRTKMENDIIEYNEWEGKYVEMTFRRYSTKYEHNPCNDECSNCEEEEHNCRMTLIIKRRENSEDILNDF